MAQSYELGLSFKDSNVLATLKEIVKNAKEASKEMEELQKQTAAFAAILSSNMKNFKEFARVLGRMAGNAKRLKEELEAAAKAAAGIPNIPGGGGGGGGNGGGGNGGGGGGNKSGGTGMPDWQRALRNLIRTTRVSSNGSVQPLIGRVADFISTVFPDAAPWIAAAAALAVAFTIARKAVDPWIQVAGMFGSSAGQIEQAAGIAGMLGTSQTTAAISASNDLSNPYLLGFAQSKGISMNFAGAFGDINNTGRFLKLFNALTNPNVSNDTAARATYGNAALGSAVLSARQSQFSPDYLKMLETIGSTPAASSNTERTSIQQSELTVMTMLKALENVFVEIYAIFAPVITILSAFFGAVLAGIAQVLGFIAKAVDWAFGWLFKILGIQNLEHNSAQNANTKALNENTNQMRKITGTSQFFGAGASSASRIIPAGLGAPTLNSMKTRAALPLGGLI